MTVLYLIITFFVNGIAGLTNKVLVELPGGSTNEANLVYLFSMYVCGTVLTYVPARKELKSINSKETFTGVFMALTSIASLYFFVRAVSSMTGVVVFPVRSIGTLLCTVLFSVVFYKERPSRYGIIGLAIAGVALVLINME